MIYKVSFLISCLILYLLYVNHGVNVKGILFIGIQKILFLMVHDEVQQGRMLLLGPSWVLMIVQVTNQAF